MIYFFSSGMSNFVVSIQPEDLRKFQKILNLCEYRMLYKATKILKDHYLVEEALQETWVTVTRKIKSIDLSNEARAVNYIETIMRNKCYHIINCHKKIIAEQKMYDDDFIPADERLDDIVDADVEAIRLANEIHKLDVKYRDVVFLRALQGRNFKDIAKIVHEKPATVRKRYQIARETLLAKFESQGA